MLCLASHWRQSFIEGRTLLPSTSWDLNIVQDVRRVIKTDRRLTLSEIFPQLFPDVGISRVSLH